MRTTGDRARVVCGDPSQWNADAQAAMVGKVATITEVKADPVTGEPYYLVEFDAPVERWAMRSSDPDSDVNQIRCWHFHEIDLTDP